MAQIWVTPRRNEFLDSWPIRRQMEALAQNAAGQPAKLHAMIADLRRHASELQDPDVKEDAIKAEYIGLYIRRARQLEEEGYSLDSIRLRLEKGI